VFRLKAQPKLKPSRPEPIRQIGLLKSFDQSAKEAITMEGRIFTSQGLYVADIRAMQIFDLSGRKLYDLRGQTIYKPTGELVGHLISAVGDRRLDKSTDRLFL
jgi:hypothetical protein